MRRTAALAGNPNVGKSTIFNGLTGLRQHTGNWAGVTVSCTRGSFSADGFEFTLVDLPGIYSFHVRSAEETAARDFIRGQNYDYLILVCDATCLERGLHLLEQAASILAEREEGAQPRLVLCLNLWDEAERKGVHIDLPLLEQELGLPVIPCCGRTKKGLRRLKKCLTELAREDAAPSWPDTAPPRPDGVSPHLPRPFSPGELAEQAVSVSGGRGRLREERLDRFLTDPWTGGFFMLLLLTGVLWLTMVGANYPSALLWDLFFRLETVFVSAAGRLGAPAWFTDAFIYGMYRVLAWIISVMLPPMAIFFPLFTLLEDAGFLPRISFNMDGAFERCSACGKQCLTMAMGLGCNAAGVVGCRIIDSPRERLIAILTNSLVPCNGRFPLLLTMVSLLMLQLPAASPLFAGLFPALALALLILLGIAATLAASWALSHTLLKGLPSAFALDLPPYRPPQVGKVIVRSIFDRTLKVLGRAAAAAAPAGLLIWCMANFTIADTSLLLLLADLLEPLGSLMGLDGIILMGFLLGFPANEIVLPVIMMAYLQSGMLVPMEDKTALLSLLAANGWTARTIICMAVFSLFHWPCSTTCLTIKKETGSLKWTAVAFLLPTMIGIVLCILISGLFHLLS